MYGEQLEVIKPNKMEKKVAARVIKVYNNKVRKEVKVRSLK